MSEEDVNKIEENRHEINTKRSTAWATGDFKDWLVEKGMSADIDYYNTETLNQALSSFYERIPLVIVILLQATIPTKLK